MNSLISRLTIRNRLILGFGVLIILMLVSSIYSMLGFGSIGKAQEEIHAAAQRMENSSAVSDMMGKSTELVLAWALPVLREKGALLEYVQTDDRKEQERLFAQFAVLGDEILSIGAQLQRNNQALPGAEDRIRAILAMQVKIKTDAVGVIAAFDGEGEYGPDTRAAMKTFSAEANRLLGGIREFQTYVEELKLVQHGQRVGAVAQVNQSVALSQSGLDSILHGNQILVVFGVLLALYIAWLIYRSIVTPLSAAAQLANRIAQYDLRDHGESKTSNNPARDEISRVIVDIVRMRASLHDLIGKIGSMSQRLAGSAIELQQSASDITGVTGRQVDLNEQSTRVTEELAVSVDAIAAGANDAANHAREADEVVQHCVDIDAAHSMRAMKLITQEMDTADARVKELAEAAKQIGDVVTAISGIAAQTNLLALNAAIEAARAGEQGRGFSIVADEVRTLAHRTAEATSQIGKMIERMQNCVNETVSSTGRTRTTVVDSVASVTAIFDSLQRIHALNSQSMQVSNSVATATVQQSHASHEITVNLQHTVDGVRRLNDQALIIKSQAQALTVLVEDVSNAVGVFKI